MALSEHELAIRSGTVSSSRAPGVLGVCPFKKPSDVYKEVLNELDGGEYVPKRPTLAMLEGTYGEAVVVGLVKELYGMEILPAEPLRISERLSDNTDGLVIEDGVKIPVEIKTVSQWWHWTSGCPDYYLPQVDMHIMAWDAPYGYTIGWCKGKEPFVHKIQRNKHREQQLIVAIDRFFDEHIAKRIMPVDDGEASTERFNLIPSVPKKITANEEIEKLAHEFNLTAIDLSQVKQRHEQLKAKLKDALIENGNAERVAGSNFEITFKTAKPRTTVDYKGVAYALQQRVDDGYFKAVLDSNTKVADYGIRTLRTKFYGPRAKQ